MTSIIFVLLFLLQLISFYLIVLLYSKLDKVKDLEKKQNQVLAEIEDSFGAYIAEMKDENNRLLEELKNTEKPVSSAHQNIVKETNKKAIASFEQPKSYVSKKLATNSYLKTLASTEKKVPITTKEKVLFYDEEGKSIEEIAKLLQIGKTEVELFLKFQD